MSSITHTDVVRMYGGAPSGDLVNILQGAAEPRNQAVPEVVPVGTTRRIVRGPKKNGHYALQVMVDSAAGATSAATVWYSNIPDPTIVADSDWVQDTTIGSIDLTATGPKMFNIGNVFAAWVMVKAVVATSTGGMRAFIRTEGSSVSGL